MIFFAWEYKMVFISMASHLVSLWNRGLRQLESGQILRIGSHLASLIPNQIFPCGATYSEIRIKPAEDSSRYSVFFFLIQFLLDLFFVKLKLTSFFPLGRWLCNNRGRCYITAIPRCHLSSSLSPRQSDSKETSSKQNGITEKLKTYLN